MSYAKPMSYAETMSYAEPCLMRNHAVSWIYASSLSRGSWSKVANSLKLDLRSQVRPILRPISDFPN